MDIALIQSFTGTSAGETIDGTLNADRIFGLGGDDTLDGKQGNGMVDGGAGNDRLDGSSSADRIVGGKGKDTVKARTRRRHDQRPRRRERLGFLRRRPGQGHRGSQGQAERMRAGQLPTAPLNLVIRVRHVG